MFNVDYFIANQKCGIKELEIFALNSVILE